ncbi:fungal chitosanase of glycosyl hydrolase group 75-domain-containing protein [Aspergillus carlsbadensis]|nr:fungal chitosanase of glycosyl hydrolase group 75-domain-containing protein [Aspergillus carlsbadensis]
MHLFNPLLAILPFLLFLTTTTTPKEIPPPLRALYTKLRTSGPCTGRDLLKTGFFDQTNGSPPLWSYCQRHTRRSAIYLKGPGTLLANMDIDCDGVQNAPGIGDGRCTGFPDTQSQTAFRSTLQTEYNITDLNSYIHPYVVLGNTGWKPWYRTFDPRSAGVYPLSVVAVLCGERLVYGVWGDVNGDDGIPLVGEASLALASACFGNGVNGSSGWDGEDVLYLAFKGVRAVPGRGGARWDARSYGEFEGSIQGLGDRLVEDLLDQIEAGEEDNEDEDEDGCGNWAGDNSGNGTYGTPGGGKGTNTCVFNGNGSAPVSSGGGGGPQRRHQ